MRYVDLHIHTTYSDSSFTPQEVIEQSLKSDLSAVAITDHDSVDGIEPAIKAADKRIEVIPGIELSSIENGKDIHFLGYFIDYEEKNLLQILKRFKTLRVDRAKEIIRKLRNFNIKINFEHILQIVGKGSIGRPHIARMLLKEGYVASYRGAFRRFLADDAPCYVPRYELGQKEAIQIIRDANGIPVLAHPLKLKVADFIPKFIEYGLLGIEAWHPEHNKEAIEYYTEYARKKNLVATGGSDCHGNIKRPMLGKLKVPYSVLEDLKEIKSNVTRRGDCG